ncbi:MAG: hypothetical protein HY996_04600 [Micrococcales bacterium]|nr:hypothetical protein [Micrococcales bacterium]
MRRLLCFVVAFAAGIGGHAVVYTAAASSTARFDPDAPLRLLPAGLVVLLGALLAAIALATAAWSALGVTLLAVVEMLVGTAGIVVPLTGAGGLKALIRSADGVGDATSAAIGTSLLFAATSGLLLIEGILSFVIALTLRARRIGWVERPVAARVTSSIVAMLCFPPLVLGLLHAGFQQYRAHVLENSTRLDAEGLLGLVVLMFGSLVLIVLALGTRWSGLGAILTGLVLTAGGAVAALPGVLALVPVRLPAAIDLTIGRQLAFGGIAAIGLLLLFGGIGSVIAGRVGERRQSFREPSQDWDDAPFGIPSYP